MKTRLDLGGAWQVAEVNGTAGLPKFGPAVRWLKARVPGDIWQDLLANKKIPRPFDHMNIPKLQWIEDRTWCYRKTFRAPDRIAGRAELVFEGLDTFAEVFLDGVSLGRTDNMFRPWSFDVTDRLLAGREHELLVVFRPWKRFVKGKEVPDQWAPFSKERVWVRKTQMELGWDFSPRVCLSGLWRPVRLEVVDAVRIASWHFKTLRASASEARVRIEADLDRVVKGPVHVQVVLRNGSQKLTAETVTTGDSAAITLRVPNPKLWWPRNLGKPDLYEVTLTAYVGEAPADRVQGRSGIRTVELLQRPQPDGCKSFTFAVNGKKVYLAGADWIPADNFLSAVTPTRYRAHLQRACEANMNTIRVWGGGIYEDEAFYNACDELGLLVWQDFMFACGVYPGNDPAFRANVTAEFKHVIRRLRVHPSIVLWNGNNECQWLDTYCCWNRPDRKMPDRVIFFSILPRLTRVLDGTRPYWPSSPFGGNDANDWRQGNHHSWKVWAGCKIPRKRNESTAWPQGTDPAEIRHYRHYADAVPRFCSEFGLQGLPYKKTLLQYLTQSELKLSSPTLIFRDKVLQPEGKILQAYKWFLESITGWVKDYDDFELKTQLGQARGLEFGIAHHRRHLWQCSGSLIWQLNDCWPGFSWSLLDYHRLPKPAYFAVRRVFAPRLLSLVRSGYRVELWAVNTSGKNWAGRVRLSVRTFRGKLLGTGTAKIAAANDTSNLILRDVLQACGVTGFNPAEAYVKVEVVGGPRTFDAWWLEDPVRLDLPKARIETSVKVKKSGGGYRHEVTIRSRDHFACFVGIVPPDAECRFDDNFIHVEPGGEAKITFFSSRTISNRALQIRGYNTGR